VPYIRGMGFERASAPGLAARLFGRDGARAVAVLRAAWPRAVGPDLARRTEILALEGVTLRVRVPDARWRGVLHRMQPEILARLGELAGSLAPRRLGFVEGGIAALPARPADEGVPADAAAVCPPAVASEAAAIADPELRERFLDSAARYLARARRRPGA
jgi:hypothetical protein